MEIGCGLQVRRVRNRRYLYFWRYHRVNGRSSIEWKYVGPVASLNTKGKALELMKSHYSIARREIDRRLRLTEAAMERL